MKSMLSVVLGLVATCVLGAETIKLPAPDADSGVTVMQALNHPVGYPAVAISR